MVDIALRELIRNIRLIIFDFDGVFTDNAVYVSEDGKEMIRSWRGDGLGLRMLDALNVAYLVLSTEENPVVSARCRKLKVPCIQGCPDKLVALKQLSAERGIPLASIAYLGNDINDSTCLQAVGLPMVVQDAYPDVLALARYRTETRGGYGAVREVCELFRRTASNPE